MRVTGGNCTLPAIRIWLTTTLAAPHQRLIDTNPRSAACAISTAQITTLMSDQTSVWGRLSIQVRSAHQQSQT